MQNKKKIHSKKKKNVNEKTIVMCPLYNRGGIANSHLNLAHRTIAQPITIGVSDMSIRS